MQKPFTEYSLKKGNVIAFHGQRSYMTMISKSDFFLNGQWFTSVEHYYQFTKLCELLDRRAASSLKLEKVDPHMIRLKVRSFVKSRRVGQPQIDEWKNRRAPAVLYDAIKAKFDQNPLLRKKLMETDRKVLVNTYNGDRFFTSGSSQFVFMRWLETQNKLIQMPTNLQCFSSIEFPIIHQGHNVLGFLMMELRDTYLRQMVNSLVPVPPPPTFAPPVSYAGVQNMSNPVNLRRPYSVKVQPIALIKPSVYLHTSTYNSTTLKAPYVSSLQSKQSTQYGQNPAYGQTTVQYGQLAQQNLQCGGSYQYGQNPQYGQNQRESPYVPTSQYGQNEQYAPTQPTVPYQPYPVKQQYTPTFPALYNPPEYPTFSGAYNSFMASTYSVTAPVEPTGPMFSRSAQNPAKNSVSFSYARS
ncbi:unnamed protein product [Bursaphelenchus okinawaensis]|uniref:NADAR domain-containing protein n=1 Tax=Bursaphelenchus okinawaensis TaxID=465554 RepID=A0A811LM75_9BILA|nr:unnamed protein product [Bursaphelenchus okinawaensis]CAG9127003.1 unnamed protein product [Bursaphelenchus okinawaensis]